jgi:hypothetical protein
MALLVSPAIHQYPMQNQSHPGGGRGWKFYLFQEMTPCPPTSTPGERSAPGETTTPTGNARPKPPPRRPTQEDLAWPPALQRLGKIAGRRRPHSGADTLFEPIRPIQLKTQLQAIPCASPTHPAPRRVCRRESSACDFPVKNDKSRYNRELFVSSACRSPSEGRFIQEKKMRDLR